MPLCLTKQIHFILQKPKCRTEKRKQPYESRIIKKGTNEKCLKSQKQRLKHWDVKSKTLPILKFINKNLSNLSASMPFEKVQNEYKSEKSEQLWNPFWCSYFHKKKLQSSSKTKAERAKRTIEPLALVPEVQGNTN